MKKLVTFLLSLGAFATSFAQYNQPQDYPNGDRNIRTETRRDDQYAWKNSPGVYDRNYDDRRFNGNYYFTMQERDFQIARINREFDYKVASIRNDRFLRRHEMKRMISDAEFERD